MRIPKLPSLEMTPEERQARRERIEECEDLGICFECGKPILEGQARYTITHSHWDCHEKATPDFDKADTALTRLKELLK